MANSAGFLQFVVAATAGQVALAAVLSIMLGGFHRFYRHEYLRHWSLSWLALVVYVVASSAAGITSGSPPPLGLRVPAAAIGLVAGYLQIAWLLLGDVGPEDRGRGAAPDREVRPMGRGGRRARLGRAGPRRREPPVDGRRALRRGGDRLRGERRRPPAAQ